PLERGRYVLVALCGNRQRSGRPPWRPAERRKHRQKTDTGRHFACQCRTVSDFLLGGTGTRTRLPVSKPAETHRGGTISSVPSIPAAARGAFGTIVLFNFHFQFDLGAGTFRAAFGRVLDVGVDQEDVTGLAVLHVAVVHHAAVGLRVVHHLFL